MLRMTAVSKLPGNFVTFKPRQHATRAFHRDTFRNSPSPLKDQDYGFGPAGSDPSGQAAIGTDPPFMVLVYFNCLRAGNWHQPFPLTLNSSVNDIASTANRILERKNDGFRDCGADSHLDMKIKWQGISHSRGNMHVDAVTSLYGLDKEAMGQVLQLLHQRGWKDLLTIASARFNLTRPLPQEGKVEEGKVEEGKVLGGKAVEDKKCEKTTV